MANQNKHYKFLILLLISLILNISKTFADQFQLQKKILNENNKLSAVEEEIRTVDSQISEQTVMLTNVNKIIADNNNKKTSLEATKTQKLHYLQQQQQQLKQQLQATYLFHRNNHIQKLININNIQQLNRLLTYLQYYNYQNIDNINKIKLSLTELDRIDADLTAINSEHEKYKQKITDSYNNLKKLKTTNLSLKEKLKLSLKTTAENLAYYKNRQTNLSELLIDNNNEVYNEPTQGNNISGLFAKAKGNLATPVSGMIDLNFKNNKNRKSLFIKTNEGQEVKAIFSGKVVFSNWLRGFGFLTILNHGNGYMSLYGHNQTLLKKTGDTIKAGEVIALTGASGGINQPGLYFEIRYNGAPVNPLAWLKTDLRKNFSSS